MLRHIRSQSLLTQTMEHPPTNLIRGPRQSRKITLAKTVAERQCITPSCLIRQIQYGLPS